MKKYIFAEVHLRMPVKKTTTILEDYDRRKYVALIEDLLKNPSLELK